MVSLVGAGPGDMGLLTLLGAKRIQSADVVLFDRFVCDEILSMIPESAKKVNVGKNAGNHPVPQDKINMLLLDYAMQGKNVVRLKGGDPFVFGRGGEELALLCERGIPFEVIPGVTSAVAGAAYAGIPVTHRDYASSFHVITAQGKNGETINIDYGTLVRLGGTLIFMMGVAVIGDICDGCIANGMDGDMPAAIVENATTNLQRKFLGTVGTLPSIARDNAVVSPAIIIIGKVCLLGERYDWFSQKPLFRKRVFVAGTKPQLHKQAAGQKPCGCNLPGSSKLSDKLKELGCVVTELPPARIIPLFPDVSDYDIGKALGEITDYSWLIFTSAIGVNIFFDYLIKTELDIRSLHHLKIACVGQETNREVTNRGIKSEYVPAEYNGVALARGLSGLLKRGDKALIARAKDGAEDLTRILTDAGIDFVDLAIYEKIYTMENIMYNDNDCAAFTSSSAVLRFAKSVTDVDLSKVKAVCIGERTAETARSYGMEVYVCAESTIESMIEKIKTCV